MVAVVSRTRKAISPWRIAHTIGRSKQNGHNVAALCEAIRHSITRPGEVVKCNMAVNFISVVCNSATKDVVTYATFLGGPNRLLWSIDWLVEDGGIECFARYVISVRSMVSGRAGVVF